jgi:hypothetical protein
MGLPSFAAYQLLTEQGKQPYEEGLFEKLITFGGKAYPKFNQVVIMAGGAASGKGFTQEKLMGIEGIVLDVDHVKKLAIDSTNLAARIKKETGDDIKDFDLKNPDQVARLHQLLSDEFKITKKYDQKVFAGILTAAPDRKPNIIFDVTLKDMSKMARLAVDIQKLGYSKENVHIVWVMNDVHVAIEQNKTRSRTVPIEILVATHEGAALTFKNLMAMGEGARSWADGDWYISFNKIGVDSELAKSENGGSYVVDANYIKVKKKGGTPMKATALDQEIIKKISDYIPNAETWAMALKDMK